MARVHSARPFNNALHLNRCMLLLLLLVLLALPLPAPIRPQDYRQTDRAATKTHFELPHYRSLDEWSERRNHLRDQILISAGLYPMPDKKPLNVRRFARIARDGYTVEQILLETSPGLFVAGNLYLPERAPGRIPGVLIAHGHWKHGRVENLPSYSVPALGANLAKQGYAAFAWDMLGYNDTRQLPHSFGESKREQEWAFGPLGVQLWNSIRALDFISSLPEVDPERIAVTGASGGGTQTILLAAVDERVTVSAPVNMVSAHFQGGSPCENAPGLRIGTNNVEIAALMAPRPMLLIASTKDWTRNTPTDEFPTIRGIYELYGRSSDVSYVQIDAEHNYNRQSRQAFYSFLSKRFFGVERSAESFEEISVADLESSALLLKKSRPEGSLSREQLFERWREDATDRAHKLQPGMAEERFRRLFGAEWPASVEVWSSGDRIVLSRSNAAERVAGMWLPSDPARMALIVHPDGSNAAAHEPKVRRLIADGYSVLLLDPFESTPSHGRFHLTFHRSGDANQVQDIVLGAAFLASPQVRELMLVTFGRGSLWGLAAAAVSPFPMKLAVESRPADLPPDAFFVPGFSWAGGWRVVESIVASRHELLIDRTEPSVPVTGH